MKIDDKLISDLAKLAKLSFDKESSKKMKDDLKKIIGFVDKLSEIDTEIVEPLIYLSEESNVLRKENNQSQSLIHTGLWARSRHPN